MAFNNTFGELDSKLSDLQYELVKKSNFDLPFGGTSDKEYDFLAQNGAVNKMAPNFLSFMAGVAGANLATQQHRKQQFDDAQAMRDMQSTVALRGAQTRQVGLEADTLQAKLPYVAPKEQENLTQTQLQNTGLRIANKYQPQINEANIAQTEAATRNTHLQADTTAAKLPYISPLAQIEVNKGNAEVQGIGLDNARRVIDNRYAPQIHQANIANTQANTASTNLRSEEQRVVNRYKEQDIRSVIAQRDALTEGTQANTAQQNFINDQLPNREKLYERTQNSVIDQNNAQTGYYQSQAKGQDEITALNKFKNDTAKELYDLEVKKQNHEISKEEYESQKAKKALELYEADRELRVMESNAQVNANNALADERRKQRSGPNYRLPPIVSPTATSQAPATTGQAPASFLPAGASTTSQAPINHEPQASSQLLSTAQAPAIDGELKQLTAKAQANGLQPVIIKNGQAAYIKYHSGKSLSAAEQVALDYLLGK